MSRRRKWSIPTGPTQPPEHDHQRRPEAAITLDGRELRRYDGVWCAQTRAGAWRSARWLGTVTLAQALDALWAAGGHAAPIPGQQELTL